MLQRRSCSYLESGALLQSVLSMPSLWILLLSICSCYQRAEANDVPLQRIRLRGGEHPAAYTSETVEAQGAGPGGLGDSPMPRGCTPELHRPWVDSRHPLQNAVTVVAVGGPVHIADRFSVLDSVQSSQIKTENDKNWLQQAFCLYVPDHRRYSRGGSLWTYSWLLKDGQSTDSLVDETQQASWAGRVLALLSSVRALSDGFGPSEALNAALPWALDPNEWLAAAHDHWREGVFSALAILGELLCYYWTSHSVSSFKVGGLPVDRGVCAQQIQDMGSLREGHRGNASCVGHDALAVLEEFHDASFEGAALALAGEMLASCSLHEAAGAAAWSAFWWRLAFWHSTDQETGECPAVVVAQGMASPLNRRTLQLRLCGAKAVSSGQVQSRNVRENIEMHILGVTAALITQKSQHTCVLLEAVLHISSGDSCYVTQAGSNLRTLPHSFLADWQCSLGHTQHLKDAFARASGSASSAFGTDAVIRCAFQAEVIQAASEQSDILFLHLSTRHWGVEGIPLCANLHTAGSAAVESLEDMTPRSSSMLQLAPDPPLRRLTVCTGMIFNGNLRLPGTPSDMPSLFEQWLLFHEEVGVDHFWVYDSDGSAASTVLPIVKRGKISYFPHWPAQRSRKLGEISIAPHCRHCLSVLAESHCLWANRGLSQWVITLHSFDAYLAVTQNWAAPVANGAALSRPLDVLETRRKEIGTVAIAMIDFGGPPVNSSWLVERFQHRAIEPVQVLAEIGRGNPRDDCWLNHPGVTLRNPNNVWGVYDHYARSHAGSLDVEIPFQLLRVNHYVDTFSERCSSRFLHCEVPDTGSLWVMSAMRARWRATQAARTRG
eukprot:TRINITY_DN57792_c0_g1_i1.p1 TRINITY_DN57792_c0_g1~~TRINITY_DN57792_c0_g1_i1.p1  ORF type:complete len:833 (+),score=125.05 TRINITY_DN57792_c0_g1_i1:129-2627(+)